MSKHLMKKSAAVLAVAALLASFGGAADAAPVHARLHHVASLHGHHRHAGRNFMNGPMTRQMMGMIGPMLAGAVANGGVGGLGGGSFGGADTASYAPMINTLMRSGALSGAMSGMGGSGMNLGALAGMAGAIGGGTTPY